MTTLGVIVGNRGFFPSELCEDGRITILKVLEAEGFGAVILSPEDLPNFGEERGVADAIKFADLDVPVLVQAFPDVPTEMDISRRRDSFCGKMSVCNNLMQYGIPYSLTMLHTVDPESESFRQDLSKFGAICRVVKGMRSVRFGQVGARPAAFITVRYSEKLLERAGISVDTIDLSEIFGWACSLKDDDAEVLAKRDEIQAYIEIQGIPADALIKMAKFAVVLDRWVAERELAGTAIQCWTSMEEFYGVVPCTVMSMLSNKLLPSACETDVTGLIGMYAMVLASGTPSALLDWNNNYGTDPDKAVVFHCSNLPKDLFGGPVAMDYQAIIAGTVGRENTFGTVVGRIKPTKITFCRVSTDDMTGTIRAYLGEAIPLIPLAAMGLSRSRGSKDYCTISVSMAMSITWPSTLARWRTRSLKRLPSIWGGMSTITRASRVCLAMKHCRQPAFGIGQAIVRRVDADTKRHILTEGGSAALREGTSTE